MVTKIDNTQRVFIVEFDYSSTIFCNLQDIPAAIKQAIDKQSITIYHYWNFKKKKASKKMLNSMFKCSGMKIRVK